MSEIGLLMLKSKKGKHMKKIFFLILIFLIAATAYAETTVKEYYRPDCPHCQKMVPIVEQFEKEHPEIKFQKMNIYEKQKEAMKDNAMSVPTFIVYKDGKEIGGFMGERPADIFTKEIMNPRPRQIRPSPQQAQMRIDWIGLFIAVAQTFSLITIAISVAVIARKK